MKKGKKDKTKNKINNRLLYTLISFGILILVAGCIYAVVNTNQAYHSALQIDFSGVEINPSKINTTTLCLGNDCKTSWPSAVVGGTGVCPDEANVYYSYFNGEEDTLSGFTSQNEPTDTCGTSTTTSIDDASTFCSVTSKSTCIDLEATSGDDGITNVVSIGAYRSCDNFGYTDDCNSDYTSQYTCPIGTVKECLDVYSTGVGGYNSCYKRDIQCRNYAQTVTCKRNMSVGCIDN